jgi:hypothetical protein
MRTHQSRRRSAARINQMIGLAAMAGLGLYHNTEDDKGGGGGEKKDDKKKEKKVEEPEKVEMTKSERDQLIADAKAEAKREADEARQKEREAAEKADLEKKGEIQTLLDKEKEEHAQTKAENQRLRTESALRDHLADKHPTYIGVAKYILPMIPADAKDSELKVAIEKAAEDYVKDNPREAKGTGAPPVPPRTGNRTQGERQHKSNNGSGYGGRATAVDSF